MHSHPYLLYICIHITYSLQDNFPESRIVSELRNKRENRKIPGKLSSLVAPDQIGIISVVEGHGPSDARMSKRRLYGERLCVRAYAASDFQSFTQAKNVLKEKSPAPLYAFGRRARGPCTSTHGSTSRRFCSLRTRAPTCTHEGRWTEIFCRKRLVRRPQPTHTDTLWCVGLPLCPATAKRSESRRTERVFYTCSTNCRRWVYTYMCFRTQFKEEVTRRNS